MYLIDIQITGKNSSKQQMESHHAWFKRHFQQGDFLIVGPSKTKKNAGIIIAKEMERQKLKQIIAEDEFYPNKAIYSVNEFIPKMIVDAVKF